MKVFAGNSNRHLAEAICKYLNVPLGKASVRRFADQEIFVEIQENVRGEDVYVVQSLHGDATQSPNDKLCRLLFFLATMKENGAARITAIIPYLAYARKDRQITIRDPVTTRYVAQLLEATGIHRVVTIDVHNISAFQNAFRCETVHLDTRRLFVSHAANLAHNDPITVLSPDPGGVKRAQLFCETLEHVMGRPVNNAFMERRNSARKISGKPITGDIDGATVFIVDDLIGSGGTITQAAQACRESGARAVYAFAAHGLFTGDAANTLRDPALARTFVTDTVPPFRLDTPLAGTCIETVSAAPLFAKAIGALRNGSSINALLE